jgi:CheY-like chemotaxis protein
MDRILIIDDDPLVRQTVRVMLESARYQIEEAADVGAALELAAKTRPDLALTDILMPEQDGIEFILQLRRTDPSIKIVAMSGGGSFSPDQLLVVAKALGADDYIAKPFSKTVLLAKLASCLAKISPSAASA